MSPLPLTKYGEKCFRKKAFHGGTSFFGTNLWGMFDMGTNNQIMQGGELMVIKRFQRSIQNSFSLIDPELGY